jgi:hypothetical protein
VRGTQQAQRVGGARAVKGRTTREIRLVARTSVIGSVEWFFFSFLVYACAHARVRSVIWECLLGAHAFGIIENPCIAFVLCVSSLPCLSATKKSKVDLHAVQRLGFQLSAFDFCPFCPFAPLVR